MADWPLITASAIGSITAVVHGVLMKKHLIGPTIEAVEAAGSMPNVARRLISPLYHVSTFVSLTGGVALWAADLTLARPHVVPLAGFMAIIYGQGAIVNGVATRFRHPGFFLLASASLLIVF